MLERSVWAPYKTAQLVKGLEASTKTSDQDHGKVVVHEPFPELIANASRNATHTVASVASAWSETKTAQLIKGLETQAPSSRLAPQLQKSAEAFSALGNPAGISAEAVGQAIFAAEATQFWGGLTKRIASPNKETVIDSSENMEKLRAEMVGPKTGHGRNRRRWAPLQL
jgi:hypothetical protein